MSAVASAPVTSISMLLDHSPTNNMKIRLETTNSDPKYSHSVEITVQQDDLNIHQLWDDLIVPALLGFGFAQSSIDEINQP